MKFQKLVPLLVILVSLAMVGSVLLASEVSAKWSKPTVTGSITGAEGQVSWYIGSTPVDSGGMPTYQLDLKSGPSHFNFELPASGVWKVYAIDKAHNVYMDVWDRNAGGSQVVSVTMVHGNLVQGTLSYWVNGVDTHTPIMGTVTFEDQTSYAAVTVHTDANGHYSVYLPTSRDNGMQAYGVFVSGTLNGQTYTNFFGWRVQGDSVLNIGLPA